MNSEFSHSLDFQKALENLSGLEFMQKIAHGELPQPPMGKTLGFRVVEADSGKVIFEGEPNSSHYNPIGSVHGGFASVLLDSAMGCAVHTKLPAGIFYTTLELKINLVRAIQENTGMLRATGSVIHCGRRTATVESRLEDRSEKLYAHGTSTCLIFSD
jgi:uncharacterized protein (TIGR00369 family)